MADARAVQDDNAGGVSLAQLDSQREGDRLVVRLAGSWTTRALGSQESELARLKTGDASVVRFEFDRLLLEYDTERAGGFEPLRFVPKGVQVVLGLVTTKRGDLEDAEELLRRIDDASRYIDPDRLALSPQCGVASGIAGNAITEDEQWRKLELIGETAARAWGRA